MKFHVTFKENKKLLDIQQWDIGELEAAICSVFPILDCSKVLVQWFLRDVEDWVDLDCNVMKDWRAEKDFSIKRIRVSWTIDCKYPVIL